MIHTETAHIWLGSNGKYMELKNLRLEVNNILNICNVINTEKI